MALHTPHLSLDDPASRAIKHTPVAENSLSAINSLGGPSTILRDDLDGRIAFQPWEVDRKHAPDCWDAQRIAALHTGERRDKAWLARRKHAPCCTKVPPAWGLD
jgi:hypothetical protein